ncbi:MAG: ABC transporter ATP-binding protein [Promethearchaeota archaeon]|jgi:oligopeptide transport system ATP-binding protein
MVGLMEIIIIPVILFIIGFFIMRQFAQEKRWENSVIITLITNLIWLVFSILLTIIILNSFGFFLFKILLIVILIPVGILILWGFYNKTFFESIKVISIIQAVLLVISLFLRTIPRILTIWLIEGNDDLDGSKFTFTFAFLFLLGLSILMAYWGNKIQLVRYRITFTLASIAPGIYYLIITFITQHENFYDGAIANISISFIIAIISISIAKIISYQTIQFKELRGLTVLEKDKALLNVQDLKVHYPLFKGTLKRQIGSVKAVNGVSFSIKTGETLGLVGESGCGKTTIAKAILGLVEKTEGEMVFQDKPIPPKYSAYLRHKIQMVFQDPDASLNPRMKIVDIIAEPLRNLLAITNKLEIRKRVLRLLDEVSLKREHMDRYPHEFSGGQKQRIVIARALACNPELIILDEPSSALDVSVQAQILNLLRELQAEYGYGYLFITHNLAVVNYIADRVAVMYLGKIVEVGSKEQVFSKPTHPYTQALLSSHSDIDPYDQEISFVIEGEVPSPIAPPPGCTFNPRCSSDARTKECEIEIPHKIKIEEGHFIWCNNPPTSMQSKNQESKESFSLE